MLVCRFMRVTWFRLALPLLAAAGIVAPVQAKVAQGTADAIVVTQLSFFSVDDLAFGSIVASASAGTVTINPDGTRASTGGVTPIGGGFLAARFAGRGSNGQTVSISMASTPINITRVGGTQTMQVRTFVIGSTPTAVLTATPQRFRINSATGIFIFTVGAQLVVNANQTPGTYKGNYSVILNYQ